jgi:hypothetical protein
MFKPLSIVILGAVAAGCAMTTEQQAATECGAATAVGTAIYCKLKQGKDEDCAKAALDVGLAASYGCYAWSKELDHEHQALAGHENDLDRQLHFLTSVNAAMARNNDDLKRRIDASSQHAETTATQVRTQSAQQAKLKIDSKQLDAYIKENENAIAFQRQNLADIRAFQARTGNHSPDLSAQIRRAEANLAASLRLGTSLQGMKQDV